MLKKVLIVDDEETLTWSLSKSLSHDREVYEVSTANDGETALSILNKQLFDVVVLDIRLPGINGLDLLSQIKQEMPTTKVIMMTAYGSSEIKAKAKAKGSNYYIEKPFEIDTLRSLILKALKENNDRGFKGSISGLQLPDLIQMNCLSQITTALYVKKDDREGVIYFEDGQITHAKIGALEGEEALFTILSWQSGSFRFVGGYKAPKVSINTNWEYLLIEGMRKADEMSFALEKGEIDDKDIAPIDEQSRMLIKNISALDETKGLAIIAPGGDVLYKSGNITRDLNIPFVTRFFLNLSEQLGELIPTTPKKVSFINQKRLILVYPFKIYILILLFNRAVLSQETIFTIERVISRYKVEPV
ncbi:MAG: response regulator [Deltaproteobacteria bacterium]|nr:response regulator [Deltaproteobacteria bacterium]